MSTRAGIFAFPAGDKWGRRVLFERCSFPWQVLRPELDRRGANAVTVAWTDADIATAGDTSILTYRPTRFANQDVSAQVLLHEAFHVYDKLVMTEGQRQAVRDLLGVKVRSWIESSWYQSPGEWFADAAAFAYATLDVPTKSGEWDGISDGVPHRWSWDGTDRLDRLRSILTPASTTSQPPATPRPPAFPNDTICRLYRAFFRRDPDRAGYDYWTAQRARGVTAQAIADWFAHSPEFVATYGHLDEPAFVTLVYRNVLAREPDTAGHAYWVNVLRGHSPGAVMLAFSESPEFVARSDRWM